ncbi:hypothetical protein HYALB_00002625 [Hymenoscyphus albidus]|uniref:Uncharacterized protein n=1 Tax=Hymenoscyphus albidus TaxID=595503 RepID=A0A9N9LWM0_9HELO|nr:hypothetical protein HYALB_00002625 [Hymenoscyphus albidus]
MQFRNLLVIAALATSVSAAGYSWAYCQNIPEGRDDSTATNAVCDVFRNQLDCSDCKIQQALLDPDGITKCISSGKMIDPNEVSGFYLRVRSGNWSGKLVEREEREKKEGEECYNG